MRQAKAKLLTGSSFIAAVAAGMLLAPAGALAQHLTRTVNPGEPYARAPITLAQSATPLSVETAKPEEKQAIDKPAPEAAKAEQPANDLNKSDLGNAPLPANASVSKSETSKAEAPAVTVVAPAEQAKDTAPATTATVDPAPTPAPAPVAAETKSEPAAAPAAAAETPAAPAAAAAPSLSAADQAVADRLKDLLAARSSKYLDRKGERESAAAFYKERNYAPLWIENGQANARAKAAVAYLKTVDSDGLDPAEYATTEITSGMDADALANAELKLTDAALTFARHAATGRVSFTRISNDMYYALKFPEPADVLAKLVSAGNAGDALAGYLPQHAAYKALKAKYAELRGQKDGPQVVQIANGPALKIVRTKKGIKTTDDPRVPLLRERLDVAQNHTSTVYDEDVEAAVKKFQAANSLKADGILAQSTIDALNGRSPQKKLDTILVNLERWRWIDHDLRGDTYVMVNIPDYSLKLVKNGEKYWDTRIVVGQPSKPTPLISPDMKFITVNPTWNVPPSIIAREYLPALRQDPTVLDRIGLKMTHNPDGTVRIYQPPGERNALGRIRFNFPNKFLVYQHDTPDKNLFAHDKRAYSHGCMRVQNPLTYAEKLLSIQLPNQNYTEAKVKGMLGQSEVNIDFPKPLPVHLTYQTAFVDAAGNLQFRDDVYGIDARMVKAMKSDERKVADIAVEQKGVGSATVSRDELRYDDPNRGAGFENPFLALFGIRPDPQPEARSRGDRRNNPRNGREARQNQQPNFFGLFR